MYLTKKILSEIKLCPKMGLRGTKLALNSPDKENQVCGIVHIFYSIANKACYKNFVYTSMHHNSMMHICDASKTGKRKPRQSMTACSLLHLLLPHLFE